METITLPDGTKLHYYPALEQNPETDGFVKYYGIIVRVPSVVLGKPGQNEIEDQALWQLVRGATRAGVEIGELMERYEIFDLQTGDLLAMFRVAQRT